MSLSVGEKLGPYEIISLLGKGGMGEVYKALDTRLHREVAIKVSAERFSERFEREARAIAALNHPNICTLFDVGPNYLVMEFVDGDAINTRLKSGAIPLEEAITIARQIASALECAHDKLITHRDLKPGNVMVKPDGVVKVLDFGLAKFGGSGPTSVGENSPTLTMGATVAGTILGTAAYMAPEQAKGKPVDKRADIWAFGVLLHEMVTGQQIFKGEDLTDTIAAVVMREPDLSAMPERIRPVLERCLVKDPAKRLRDISGVELLLARPAVPPAAAEPAKSGKLPWMVAAAALVVAAGVGFLYLRQPEPSAPELMRFEVATPDDVQVGAQIHISPDGRRVAFSASGGGDARRRQWIRSLDSLEAKPLAGTEGSQDGSFWLPDSKTLVFQANGKLRKIDVTGGPAQPICDFTTDVGGGFLTADNQIVFGTPATAGIQACPAGGGAAKSITTFKEGGQEVYHAFPSLLPDGRHFLFLRSAGPQTGIYVGALDAKPEEQTGRRILPDMSAPVFVAGSAGSLGTLLFARENTLMAQPFDADKLELLGEAVPVGENVGVFYGFSASQDGKLVFRTAPGSDQQLTWFSRQGQTLGTVGAVGRAWGNLRISPDGTRFAANRSEPGSLPDIWVGNLARGSETRLTSDPGVDTVPVWSPSGDRIVFSSDRDGTRNLYLRASDGAGSDQLLLKTGERKSPEDWSPDGKFLLFSVFTAKGSDTWVLPMDGAPGEKEPVPYLHSDANESNARFSADGRFVLYTSNESGTPRLYIRPFDPAAIEASGTAPGKVLVAQNSTGTGNWGQGNEVLYGSEDRKRWSVEVTRTPQLSVGTPKELGQFPRFTTGGWAPDHQRILLSIPMGAQQPSATVVLNWPAALKK